MPLLAGNPSDSTASTKNDGDGYRMACSIPLRTFDLTDEQNKKVGEAMAEHHKTGCSEASEAKFVQQMKGILTPEQFAKFKESYEASPKMKM